MLEEIISLTILKMTSIVLHKHQILQTKTILYNYQQETIFQRKKLHVLDMFYTIY